MAVQAAVVAREHDHRAVSNPCPLQSVQHTSHGVIDAVNHCRIDWIVLPLPVLQTLVLGDEILLGLDRRMDGIVRDVQEERLLAIALDELNGLVRFAVRQVLSLVPGSQRRNPHRETRQFYERIEVGWRLAVVPAAVIFVKPLIYWKITSSAEVPLPDVGAGVSQRLEHLGQCDLAVRQHQLVDRGEQPPRAVGGTMVAELVADVGPLAGA